MSVYRQSYAKKGEEMRRSRTYYVQFTDHVGRVQTIATGMRDERQANEVERMLRLLVEARKGGAAPEFEVIRWARAASPALRKKLADIGLLTPKQVAALRPISELLDDWRTHLLARETSKRHVDEVLMRARMVFEETGATMWTDLDEARVETWLADRRSKEDVSARTSNAYLSAARQFIRWAVKRGVGAEDPLRGLDALPANSDRRHERRALTVDEAQRLVAAAAVGPEIKGASGAVRALVYRVALETGLRKNEIKTLAVSDLELRGEHAAIHARAENTKNRQDAHLPLRESLAAALAEHVRGRLPTARVFDLPKTWNPQKWVETDLAAAGIKAIDGAGKVVDFHALRVTFCTTLARSGASLAVAQRMMRHSNPALTANVYTVLTRDDERAALAGLPDLAPKRPDADSAQATGTDGGLPTGLQHATRHNSSLEAATRQKPEPASSVQAPERGQFVRSREAQDADLGGALAGEDQSLRLLAVWGKLGPAARAEVLRVAEELADPRAYS